MEGQILKLCIDECHLVTDAKGKCTFWIIYHGMNIIKVIEQ